MTKPHSPPRTNRAPFARIFAALALLLPGCAATKAPLRTVAHVDLPRYQGDWFVIANIPYFAERDCVGSVESYYPRKDGRMDNYFTYHKKSFAEPIQKLHAIAKVYDTKTNAEWRIRFFGLFTVNYLVLDLDPAYQWTVVGHPSRKYGWIMARTKTLPETTYREILHRLSNQGYDPASFVKVPQIP